MAKGPIPRDTRRRYPRAALDVKVRLSMRGEKGNAFEATLRTRDISVSGVFFHSTFFLKVGALLDVEFSLPHGRPVHARGRVVRVESLDEKGATRSGFAVKFEEYFEGSDVALANHFLAPQLRDFVREYGKRHKTPLTGAQLEQAVDILAAWELSKMNDDSESPWSEEP